MGTVWYCLVALTLVFYVLLDGFDLGAGILHLVVARTGEERRPSTEGIAGAASITWKVGSIAVAIARSGLVNPSAPGNAL
jgi:cytochrome bd-type quinol oxidase subunit 2